MQPSSAVQTRNHVLIIRWQHAYPSQPLPLTGGLLGANYAPGGILLPEFYNQLGAMHGTIMSFSAWCRSPMRGIYAIQTQAEYDAWLAKEASFLTGFQKTNRPQRHRDSEKKGKPLSSRSHEKMLSNTLHDFVSSWRSFRL